MTTKIITKIELLLDLNTQLNAVHFCQDFLEKKMKTETLDNMGTVAYGTIVGQFKVLSNSLSWKIEEMVKENNNES